MPEDLAALSPLSASIKNSRIAAPFQPSLQSVARTKVPPDLLSLPREIPFGLTATEFAWCLAPRGFPMVLRVAPDLAQFRGAYMPVPVVRIVPPTFERRLFCRDESHRGSDATWGNRSQWNSVGLVQHHPSVDPDVFFQPIARDRKLQNSYHPDNFHKPGDDDAPPPRRTPSQHDSIEDAYLDRIVAGFPVVDDFTPVWHSILVDKHEHQGVLGPVRWRFSSHLSVKRFVGDVALPDGKGTVHNVEVTERIAVSGSPIRASQIPASKIPEPTPEEQWLIEFWNRKLTLVGKQDQADERKKCESDYDKLHREVEALAKQSPYFDEWQLLRLKKKKKLTIAPDENCARLEEIESKEVKEYFTQPARSICWQDDFGNMSGLSTYEAVRKPKRNNNQLIEGIELVQKASTKTNLDDIVVRVRLGDWTIAEEARLRGIGSRKMRDLIRERERVLRRLAVESQGPGQDALWKAAIANTYSGVTPTGWHILVRFPQTKPRVYPLDMGPNDGEAELQEHLLRLARLQAFQMFLNKIDKKGFKYLGLKPTTLNGDPKVQAIRKYCADKTIEAFKNGKIRDLTPTSLKI